MTLPHEYIQPRSGGTGITNVWKLTEKFPLERISCILFIKSRRSEGGERSNQTRSVETWVPNLPSYSLKSPHNQEFRGQSTSPSGKSAVVSPALREAWSRTPHCRLSSRRASVSSATGRRSNLPDTDTVEAKATNIETLVACTLSSCTSRHPVGPKTREPSYPL